MITSEEPSFKKQIYLYRFEIFLFIILWVLVTHGFYETIAFIPSSWELRIQLSVGIGAIISGFVVYKYWKIKAEHFCLKSIVYFFSALNPKYNKDLLEIFSHRNRVLYGYVVEGGDLAMILVAQKKYDDEYDKFYSFKSITSALNTLEYDPTVKELKKIEFRIAAVLKPIQEKCKHVFYNLKFNMLDMFLENDFEEAKIRRSLERISYVGKKYQNQICLDFVESVINYYFTGDEGEICDMERLYKYLEKAETKLKEWPWPNGFAYLPADMDT